MCANDTDYCLAVSSDFVSDGKGNYVADIEIGKGAYVLPFPWCGARITALLAEDATSIQIRQRVASGPLIAGTMPSDASQISIHMSDAGPQLHVSVAASTSPTLFINFTSKKDSPQ